MTKEDALTPTEAALVRALISVIVRELKARESDTTRRQKDERPEHLIRAAGRDVRSDEDREHDEHYADQHA